MPPSCACRHAWPAAGARAGGSARAVSKDIPAEIAVMYSPLGAGVRWAVHLGRAGLGSTVLVLGAGRRESPAASARRYWYDTCVLDRRAIRYLIGILGPGRLLVGTGFPAMPRETSPGTTASASS